MAEDVVERLRDHAAASRSMGMNSNGGAVAVSINGVKLVDGGLMDEAADEIERLRTELARRSPSPDAEAARREVIEAALPALFDLMDAADDALDKDTYEQFRKDEFDPPNDAEYSVCAGTVLKCEKVFEAIDKLRRAPSPPVEGEKP